MQERDGALEERLLSIKVSNVCSSVTGFSVLRVREDYSKQIRVAFTYQHILYDVVWCDIERSCRLHYIACITVGCF